MTKFYFSVGKINSYSLEYTRADCKFICVPFYYTHMCNRVCLCCMTYLRSVHCGNCTWHSVFIDFIAYRNHAHQLTEMVYRSGEKRKSQFQLIVLRCSLNHYRADWAALLREWAGVHVNLFEEWNKQKFNLSEFTYLYANIGCRHEENPLSLDW